MDSIGPLEIGTEDELLLGLARTSLNEAIVNRIQVLLGRNIDWTALVQRAAHHRVLPLLYQSLQRHFAGVTPPTILQVLQHH